MTFYFIVGRVSLSLSGNKTMLLRGVSVGTDPCTFALYYPPPNAFGWLERAPPAKTRCPAFPCAYTMPRVRQFSFLQDSDSEQDEAAAAPGNPPTCAGSISSHAALVPAAAAGPAVAARSHAAAEATTGKQTSSDEPPAPKRMRVAAGSVCLTIKQEGLPPSWPEGAFVKEEAEEGLPPAWPEGAFVKQEAEEGLPPAWPEGAFVKEEQKEQQDQQQQAQEVTSGTGAGGSGSSTQGRKLSAGMLVHAFHCTDPACQQKTCAEAKLVLKRMEVHWQQCPRRRAQQSAQQGRPPPQQAECKVCKLWEALHRTKSSSGQQSVQQRGGMQSSAAGRGQPHRPSGGPTAQNGEPSEAVRARLRQIDPAQLKQMLLSHVRFCKNEHSAGRVTTCASASSRATPRRHMLTSSSLPARARQVSTSLCSSRARGRPGGADRPATAHRAGRPRRTTRRCEWPSVSRWRVEACRCCRPAF